MTTYQWQVLDEAERVLGNLILEMGFEPESEEYEAWTNLLELIDEEKKK